MVVDFNDYPFVSDNARLGDGYNDADGAVEVPVSVFGGSPPTDRVARSSSSAEVGCLSSIPRLVPKSSSVGPIGKTMMVTTLPPFSSWSCPNE